MRRYRVVLYVLVIVAVLVLAACGGTGPAAEVPAQPAAEQPAAAAPAAAAPAAAGGETPYGPRPADAIEYPAAPELDLGGTPVQRMAIDEIVTYKALPEYHEPAWVTELVEAGELPPVEERLPKEPRVILKAGMSDGIGVYGDVWRDFSACPTAGWNNGAGVTSGWFGIESMTYAYGSLVKTGPLFRSDQDLEPFPQLAKSWEWSDDGLQLTMHLIEGAKWSDGEPFTADDVMFTWEDLINDPQIVTQGGIKGDAFNLDGQPSILEKVDDYTIKWTFALPYPRNLFYIMDETDFSVSPAHVLQPLHPKYNSSMDYQSFKDALPPDILPIATMGPWVPVEYKTDELLIMRRNPYFYTVDEEGNQLPYIDEAVYQKGPTGVGRTLCTLAGGCDHTNLENPSSEFVEALKRAQEPDAEFIMSWGPEDLVFDLWLNQSETLGIRDDRDKAVRALFREDKFRQALSHAIDRDGIAQSIMRGPFLRAHAGGLFPASPEYDRASVIYYPFNVDRAKELLAEIGLEDTDGNDILNFPADGPGAGQDVVVALNTNQDQAEASIIADQLTAMFATVGIKVNPRPVTSQVQNDNLSIGEWDMQIQRTADYDLPFKNCSNLAPLTRTTPNWNRQGEGERVLRDWEQDLVDTVTAYCAEQDLVKRKELINHYNYVYTLHNYSLGTIIGRKGLALAKRFMNVPGGTPPYMYQWVENAIMSETIWTPVEEQKEQVRPETIPVYNK